MTSPLVSQRPVTWSLTLTLDPAVMSEASRSLAVLLKALSLCSSSRLSFSAAISNSSPDLLPKFNDGISVLITRPKTRSDGAIPLTGVLRSSNRPRAMASSSRSVLRAKYLTFLTAHSAPPFDWGK